MNMAEEEQYARATGLFQVLNEDGMPGPNAASTRPIRREDLLSMHRWMKFVRVLDEKMMMRQRQGRIGFYGAITGQEATPVATAMATRESDWIFPALRESAIMLMRGFPLPKYLAQVYGSADDVLKGRQMPSHMSSKDVNQVSWSSCLGPQLPQAVGTAFAARHRNEDTVAVAFVGDGATSEPDFHSALNFAGVWKAPCVFVIQNNQWAISVPSENQTASESFAIKGLAYGVPSIRVDGNDVLALYHVLSEGIQRARNGGGPTLIEAVTYRIGAHSSSDDPTLYRSESEVREWGKRDPILRLESHLKKEKVIASEQIAALEKKLGEEIVEAIRFAETHGPPPRESLFRDVYENRPWHLREQESQLLAGEPAPDGH